MANPEHVHILKQGVDAWNQWRDAHPEAAIDLQEAVLEETALKDINLSGANLRQANLRKARLHRANLANANLSEADLYRTNLFKTNLRHAHLLATSGLLASFNKTDLSEADLRNADLREASFIEANLSAADLSGAKLYGTARDDWQIDGIRCEYVYWDRKRAVRTPRDRNFRPGEFEELYKQLPTIAYYFEHGFTPLDPLIMDQVVQAIQAQHPEFELKLDSFHSRGQPHAVFTVLHKADTDRALQQLTAAYEARLAALEGQQAQLLALFGQLVSQPRPQLISGCERVVIAGRDYVETVDGHAQVYTGDISPSGQ